MVEEAEYSDHEESSDGGVLKLMLFLVCVAVSFVKGKRTHDLAFVSLCYGRSGEDM